MFADIAAKSACYVSESASQSMFTGSVPLLSVVPWDQSCTVHALGEGGVGGGIGVSLMENVASKKFPETHWRKAASSFSFTPRRCCKGFHHSLIVIFLH